MSDDRFKAILPRLVASYESGRLVPFIGSGMSRPACSDWVNFVRGLEGPNLVRSAGDDAPSRDDLIRRANYAVRKLKGETPGSFAQRVRASVKSGDAVNPPIPYQTESLARIWWPLVLSTNYDNCYAAAFRKRFSERRHLAVVGRSSEDCQRVLNSLSTPGRSLLWALQGHLRDTPHTEFSSTASVSLEDQLVVGHEEYRRVTYRDLHFRRAFAEVFRQRSLLFLGAGIQESYLQDLFGEVLEYYGPGTRPHYAFLPEGEVDPDFMLSRFQIIVLDYPKGQHQLVGERLDQLANELSRPATTPVVWSWGQINSNKTGHWTSTPDLQVVRGPLPEQRAENECLVLSAGGSGEKFFFSEGIRKVKESWGVTSSNPDRTIKPYLGEFTGQHVYAVRARSDKDERRLTDVFDGSLALFEHVGNRYGNIRMQLLATGGHDKLEVPMATWRVRNFPERFSFIQTVCAWSKWRRENPDVACTLTLHVVLDTVYQDIASGRIDVLELLSCQDIRFFVEVVTDKQEIERRLFQESSDWQLRSVVDKLQLDPDQWTVEVTPPPGLDAKPLVLTPELMTQTLHGLGLLPGSTLHFRRA